VKALVLGGTTFLGRHLVRTLIEAGHEPAIFTRGKTHVDETLALTRYVGDRDGGLDAIPRDGWDAVIDTSGYVPAIVAASCAHLATAGRYMFTSSISVYEETAPIVGVDRAPYVARDAKLADDAPQNYGSSKRRAEDVVRAVFDERAVIVRPGLIVGPYDPTNRFTYWVDRFAAGGTVAVPGPSQRFVQFIDARDLASFMIRLIEDERSGIYDVTGLPRTTSMELLATTATTTLETDADIVWLDERFLEANGLTGWMDFPLWLGPSLGITGFMDVAVDRACAAGLTFRPLTETIRDTRAWSAAAAHLTTSDAQAGISRERERELLEAWRNASLT
jgi:2'-hydroxyisoflavone reductase